MESYLELLIATSMNLVMFNNENGFASVIVSNYYAVFTFIIVVTLPFWILIFFSCKREKWEDEEFVNKFGDVLEGTRQDYMKEE